MNLEVVTIQDCLDMCEKKGCRVVIEDGKVICFLEFDERRENE